MTVFDESGNAIPENPYPADIINLSLGGIRRQLSLPIIKAW